MSDYFEERGITPLRDGETPNHMMHLARLLRDYNMFDELNAGKLAPPASKEAVNNLEEVKIVTDGSQCPVCLKEFQPDQAAKKMPCNHLYHPECIIPWLTKTNSCPLCRHELPTDDEDYEAYRKEKIRAVAREEEIEILHNSMFS